MLLYLILTTAAILGFLVLSWIETLSQRITLLERSERVRAFTDRNGG